MEQKKRRRTKTAKQIAKMMIDQIGFGDPISVHMPWNVLLRVSNRKELSHNFYHEICYEAKSLGYESGFLYRGVETQSSNADAIWVAVPRGSAQFKEQKMTPEYASRHPLFINEVAQYIVDTINGEGCAVKIDENVFLKLTGYRQHCPWMLEALQECLRQIGYRCNETFDEENTLRTWMVSTIGGPSHVSLSVEGKVKTLEALIDHRKG